MLKLAILSFSSMLLFSCGGLNRIKGTNELDKRSGINKKKIQDNFYKYKSSESRTVVHAEHFTAWLHGHRTSDGSYFHGGKITIKDDNPKWMFIETQR